VSEKSIVVGVDGSPGSRAAFEYALEEAARREAPLSVVAAVPMPEFLAASYAAYVPPPPSAEVLDEVRRETERFVDDILAARGGRGGLSINIEVRTGRPGEIVVDAADGADLLVVGHRGRGAVASALLGSVGLYCVLHARCAVTIVRPRTADAAAPTATEVAQAPA
jgi:nucleotide-binding universal stress UspA family protein